MDGQFFTSESIQMLISSVTDSKGFSTPKLEAECLLGTIARVRSNVPTGSPKNRVNQMWAAQA